MTSIQTTRRELTAIHERLGNALQTALERHAPWELVEALIAARGRLESRILSDTTRRTMKWAHEALGDLEVARRTLNELEVWALELNAKASVQR